MGSCTSYEINDIESEEISKFTIIMPQFQTDGIHSRSDITMGEYPNISSKWADGDSIGIFPSIGDQLSFRITASGDGKSCAFDGGGWALKPSSFYTAYSPFKRSYYYQDKDDLLVNMLNQKQIGNNSTQHLGAYDIKIATGTKPADGGISFVMERKVALVRMDLTAPTAATWSSITLESDALFTTEAIMNLSSSTPTLTPKSTSKTITLELSNVTTTSENKNIIAYMMLLPIDLTNKSLIIRLTDKDGNVYFSDATIVNNRTNFTANGARWIEATCSQKTVTLSEAGELASMLTDEEIMNLTSLEIKGVLNGDDIKLLRQMTGCPEFDQTGVLEFLDLSKASIISGGNAYYSQEYTTNNVVGNYMFSNSSKLKQVKLPTNITSIGQDAFNGSNISTIIIPNNVTSIGSYAFSRCSNLETCILPEVLTKIEEGTFNRCTKLQSLEIPNSVIHIYDWAFYRCTNLNNLQLPDIFYYIGESAFSSCSSLKSINLPSTLTNIKSRAFAGCSELSSPLVIPSNVHTLGDYAFYGCSKLPSVTILGSLSYTNGIGEKAFADCTSLNTVILSDNILTIGRYAFYNCTELTFLTLPQNLETIKDYAFQGCYNLSTLTIPAKVESIGKYAFQSTISKLTEIYSLPTTPPSVVAGEFCFDSSIYSKCKLYVPEASLNNYQSKTYWKSFSDIIGIQ